MLYNVSNLSLKIGADSMKTHVLFGQIPSILSPSNISRNPALTTIGDLILQGYKVTGEQIRSSTDKDVIAALRAIYKKSERDGLSHRARRIYKRIRNNKDLRAL